MVELIFILFSMLATMVFPFVLIVIVIIVGLHLQKRRRQAWAQIATRMGFHHSHDRIWGTLQGQAVQCQIVVKGSGKNKQTYTVISCSFHPPLDLGFSVSRQFALFEAINKLFDSEDHPVGDPTFDQAFVVKGDEAERVKTLLTPKLRSHLLQIQDMGNVTLNDRGLSIAIRSAISDITRIERCFHAVAHGGALVQRIRDQVPLASPLAPHYEVWASFARANGLQGITTPFCMWGEIDNVNVSVFAVRRGRLSYNAQVLVHFNETLQHGLRVRPAGTMDAITTFFGGMDLKVGDPRFDEAFTVKSNRSDQLVEILDPQVRATLLQIKDSVGQVSVNDQGVSVTTTGFPQQPSQVTQLINAVKDVSQRIYRNARQIYSVQAGPYR